MSVSAALDLQAVMPPDLLTIITQPLLPVPCMLRGDVPEHERHLVR
jgi:hypothetical protein